MATVNTPIIQQMYVAYFNRPADFSGLANWEAYAVGKTAAQLKSAISTEFAKSAEYTIVFAGMTTSQIVTKVYNNLLNRDPEAPGLQNWVNRLADGSSTVSSLVTDMIRDAGAGDVDTIANKVKAAQSFTDALDTVPEINGYSGAAANAVAAAWLKTVGATAQSLTDATTTAALNTVTANVVSNSGANIGTTFTLTTSADNLTGTANNDVFVADNTVQTTLSAADTISGGAGTDTLKVFISGTTIPTATLSSIENLVVNGGTATGLNVSASNFDGVTSLTVDAPALSVGATGNLAAATYTVKQGQSVTLKGAAPTVNSSTTVAQAATSTATSLDLTLNGWTSSSSAVTNTVDVSGALVKTLNVKADGAASRVVLNNTGAGITKLVVTGDKAVSITESLNGLATIDASGNTAVGTGVTIDARGATVAAAFAFTGGSGNDTLVLADNALATLTAGSQLNGGEGTDKIGILDTDLTAAEFTAINAAKGMDVLGLNAQITVDASKLTGIKSFALDANAAQTINNLATGSSVAVNVAHAASINLSTATGVQDLALSIGTATTGGLAVGTVTTAATNVTLTSNGTNAAVNSLTLANADNSTYTIKGSNDLNMGTLAGTAIGSKVDAAGFTGKLSVTGSAQSDIIIGGAGDDTISGGTITASVTAVAGVTAVTAVLETQLVTLTGAPGAATSTAFLGINTTVTASDTLANNIAAIVGNKTAILAGGTATAAGITDIAAGGTAGTILVTFKGGTTVAAGTGDVAVLGASAVSNGVTYSAGVEQTKGVQGVAAVTAVVGVTASLDVLTGGAGSDIFTFATGNLDTTAGVVTATITDFVTGVDKIKLSTVAAAGSTTNYVEATSVAADLATLLTAADTATNGTVKIYVGQVGSDSYVVTDNNVTGYTDVIKLTGVALTGVAAGDFIA